MTVEVQDPFNTYTAAPGATVFPYTFKIVSVADLIATIDDIVIDLGIDFSLSGVGSNDGGDVTLSVPLSGGQVVLLKRQMTFERETDYQQNGDFNAPVVNNDFDRLWLALQQLGQDLLRSIKVPFTETVDQTISVSPASRANKALVFDASGNITASVDNYNDQAAAAAASAAAANAAAGAAASNASQTNTDRIAAEAAAASAASSAGSINPSNLMHLTGNETASGIKTFTSSPLVPAATTASQAVNKGQLDAVVIPKHISGLGISTAGSSTTISVAAGYAANSDDTVMMRLAAAINKTTAAWAVGSGNGGLDAGSIANSTFYHVHEIMRPDTGVVDVLFSLSASVPTLPANYTKFRRIGSWPTNGSGQWQSLEQDGDYFIRTGGGVLDVNATNPGTSAVLRTLSVPQGVKVFALMNAGVARGASNTTGFLITDPAMLDQIPSQASAPLTSTPADMTSSNFLGAIQITVRTNANGQVRSRLSTSVADTVMMIASLGWIDSRGRNA